MGGSGSGNWWNHSSRAVCEQQLRIDLRYLRRRRLMVDGYAGSLSWSMGDEPAGNVRYRVHNHALELIYRVRQHGSEEWQSINEFVHFAYTAQRLGGERRWFSCPRCRRRCVVLYGGTYFRCRRCYRLAYQSQREEPHWRAVSQAQKLRMRLGGSGSMDEPFPEKPKGMHWRTYRRLEAKGERLDARADAWDAIFLASFMSKHPRR